MSLSNHSLYVCQAALSVGTAIDKVRICQGKLDSTSDNVVNSFDTQHETTFQLAHVLVAQSSRR